MRQYEQRQREIVRRIAIQAAGLPVLPSGLWFHGDIRDNFYYASYLYAAAADETMQLPFEREAAQAEAVRILGEVLKLQDTDPASETYSHWPLGLDPDPRQAAPNTLPVELMGSLMVYFVRRFEDKLSEALLAAFRDAFSHIYRGRFYAKPLEHYGHHEAKYTAAKLIFGELFGDRALVEDGWDSLCLTLARVKERGMTEYGSLPWFWHWVQAFTCARELIGRADIRADLEGMLDYLWSERAQFYLRGAWVGPHARGLRHDIPRDANVLLDYVQFGDFELPPEGEPFPRTEYAGFLFYEAPEQARSTALNRSEPVEVKRTIRKWNGSCEVELHSYTYITEHYAVGGMLERFEEFDNEQHRWDVSLPLNAAPGVNTAYFFHPGAGYEEHDPRHQSGHSAVLFDKSAIIALYDIPQDQPGRIVGVLPKGRWRQGQGALFGLAGGSVYLAVYVMQGIVFREAADRIEAGSKGRRNGVVIEALSVAEAEELGIDNLDGFVAAMSARPPVFSDDGKLRAEYATLRGKQLALEA